MTAYVLLDPWTIYLYLKNCRQNITYAVSFFLWLVWKFYNLYIRFRNDKLNLQVNHLSISETIAEDPTNIPDFLINPQSIPSWSRHSSYLPPIVDSNSQSLVVSIYLYTSYLLSGRKNINYWTLKFVSNWIVGGNSIKTVSSMQLYNLTENHLCLFKFKNSCLLTFSEFPTNEDTTGTYVSTRNIPTSVATNAIKK